MKRKKREMRDERRQAKGEEKKKDYEKYIFSHFFKGGV
jgi:hypothetical protein